MPLACLKITKLCFPPSGCGIFAKKAVCKIVPGVGEVLSLTGQQCRHRQTVVSLLKPSASGAWQLQRSYIHQNVQSQQDMM